MAEDFIEGFDDGLALDRWSFSGGVAADIHTDYGRNGKGARVGDTPANQLEWILNVITDPYLAVGFAAKVIDYGGTSAQLFTPDAARYGVRIDETGQRIGYENDSLFGAGGVNWAANNSFLPNVWHYVEFYHYLDNSAGFRSEWMERPSYPTPP